MEVVSALRVYAIEHGDARLRASALRYVDNLLTPPLRKRVMPLVDDVPIDEKVRRANVVLKTRPRDAEETLLQLINDGDQVVAAAAIDFVEERKLWTLANDIEFVLAHREAKDWDAFEAASWALAAYRLPGISAAASGSSRCRWCSLQHACATCRCSRRSRSPSFSESPEAVARLSTRADASSIRKAAVPEQLQFLLDGTVTAKADGEDARSIGSPASLGFEEILEGRAMAETIRTGRDDGVPGCDPRRAPEP